jgi:hypothetical protein
VAGGAKSWNGGFRGQDFQFVEFGNDEAWAREFFAKQLRSKNLARLQQQDIDGMTLWVSKTDKKGKSKDGYLVQPLAMRVRGLPDAYTITDTTGVEIEVVEDADDKPKSKPIQATESFHPEVLRLVSDLVGGVQAYTQRASQAAGGIVPTLPAIERVRNELIPAAMQQIARIGDDVDKQVQDQKLQAISRVVASLVPRPIPRTGSQEMRARIVIMSAANILAIQQDLDAFESALKNQDVTATTIQQQSPDDLMNATIRWIDPKSELGRWVEQTYRGMSNNKHSYLRGKKLRVKGIYSVSRPRVDRNFMASIQRVAAARQGYRHQAFADLQPRTRPDCSDVSDFAPAANMMLGIHGTRPVNVAPIMQSDLRLPQQLSGVVITGAAFGHGIYWAVDRNKSYGYTGHGNAYWGSGGQIDGRGFFMFLADVIMGKPHLATGTGSWTKPPGGCDSVFAAPRPRGQCYSLENDEHITFDPTYHRVRYMIEADF